MHLLQPTKAKFIVVIRVRFEKQFFFTVISWYTFGSFGKNNVSKFTQSNSLDDIQCFPQQGKTDFQMTLKHHEYVARKFDIYVKLIE